MGNAFANFKKRKEWISLNKCVGCVPAGGFVFVRLNRRRASVKERKKWLWQQTVRSEAEEYRKAEHQILLGAFLP